MTVDERIVRALVSAGPIQAPAIASMVGKTTMQARAHLHSLKRRRVVACDSQKRWSAVIPDFQSPRSRSDLQRFEDLWVPVPESGCWIWSGSHRGHEHPVFGTYGCFRIGGRMEAAHRVSWRLYRGDFDENLLVLHKCDVRWCVNPDHLFLGTQKDNVQDCKAKGRISRRRGEDQWLSTLSDDQVAQIKIDGRILREVAGDYGVSISTVWNIRNGRTWRHVKPDRRLNAWERENSHA